MKRMAHLFPGGIFVWNFNDRVTSVKGYLQQLIEVILRTEIELNDQHNYDVRKLGSIIIEHLRSHANCLLILNHAEILDFGEKEGNEHAIELRQWLRNVESVRDSVKLLLISDRSLPSWKGGRMQLDDVEEKLQITRITEKGAYQYFCKCLTIIVLVYSFY